MYKDLKATFWWLGMKKDVGHFVARCLVCQQVKAEYSVQDSPCAPDQTANFRLSVFGRPDSEKYFQLAVFYHFLALNPNTASV